MHEDIKWWKNDHILNFFFYQHNLWWFGPLPKQSCPFPGDLSTDVTMIGLFCSAKPVAEYIDRQFDNYLQEELKIRRNLASYEDTRIHVCIYFIPPTGHSWVQRTQVVALDDFASNYSWKKETQDKQKKMSVHVLQSTSKDQDCLKNAQYTCATLHQQRVTRKNICCYSDFRTELLDARGYWLL